MAAMSAMYVVDGARGVTLPTQGRIWLQESPDTHNKGNSWLCPIQLVEAFVKVHHEGRHALDHELRARTENLDEAMMEARARIRAIDDVFGPTGPDRAAAEGVKASGETCDITLTQADMKSLSEGEAVTDNVMKWRMRELRNRTQPDTVWFCDAMLGHDIVNDSEASELLIWHRTWVGKGRGPAFDYTRSTFVVMPVKDGDQGWFLIMLCHLTGQKGGKYKPSALVMDPRSSVKKRLHANAVAKITAYMREWRDRTWGQTQEDLTLRWLTVPQGAQGYESGIVVLHMAGLLAQQCGLKHANGRQAPFGPFGALETSDQQTWFNLRSVITMRGDKPRLTKPTLRERLEREARPDGGARDDEEQKAGTEEPQAWTGEERVISEPATATHSKLMGELKGQVSRMMQQGSPRALRWRTRTGDKPNADVPRLAAEAINNILHAAWMSTTWGGIGCNRTHALQGRGTWRVHSWELTMRDGDTGEEEWALPTGKHACPAALWVINLALSEGGEYAVHFCDGDAHEQLRLTTQGNAYAFLGQRHLDAGSISLTTVGATRLVELCVGLAWNKPVTLAPGEHWDDHDPHGLRLIIDQEGPGDYSRERFGLVAGTAARMRTKRHVCPWCDVTESCRANIMRHIQSHHRRVMGAGETHEIYAREMSVYWEWRRFDTVVQRILNVEQECGITTCCPTIRRPAAPRPPCLKKYEAPHAVFEGGIKIGDKRRPERYLFRRGMARADVLAAKDLADSQEGQERESAIHDVSGELGATVRIIPYAEEEALKYLEGRPANDVRKGCILRREDTRTLRRELHERIRTTIEKLARKVGEPVRLRGFMELIINKPGAQGQDWHMDIFMGAWNFTWRIQGRAATRFMDIPYQGFPDYLLPGKSNLRPDWSRHKEADVQWENVGDISMFRADALHAGPANTTGERRIAGFMSQLTTEDADDFVITERVLFPRKADRARLPDDAPAKVHRALERESNM